MLGSFCPSAPARRNLCIPRLFPYAIFPMGPPLPIWSWCGNTKIRRVQGAELLVCRQLPSEPANRVTGRRSSRFLTRIRTGIRYQDSWGNWSTYEICDARNAAGASDAGDPSQGIDEWLKGKTAIHPYVGHITLAGRTVALSVSPPSRYFVPGAPNSSRYNN